MDTGKPKLPDRMKKLGNKTVCFPMRYWIVGARSGTEGTEPPKSQVPGEWERHVVPIHWGNAMKYLL